MSGEATLIIGALRYCPNRSGIAATISALTLPEAASHLTLLRNVTTGNEILITHPRIPLT